MLSRRRENSLDLHCLDNLGEGDEDECAHDHGMDLANSDFSNQVCFHTLKPDFAEYGGSLYEIFKSDHLSPGKNQTLSLAREVKQLFRENPKK